MIIAGSASWEVVDRKAHLAGNGLVLAKRCNATDDSFPTRPKGGSQVTQYGVAVLEKDQAILFGLRLVLDHLGTSEPVIVTLKEHSIERSTKLFRQLQCKFRILGEMSGLTTHWREVCCRFS